MCRQTSLWIDIRGHHMEKEEWHCQVTDAWQEDKLAQRIAGSRSACFSGYTPGLEGWGEPFHNTRRDTQSGHEHSGKCDHALYSRVKCVDRYTPILLLDCEDARSPCYWPPLPPPDQKPPQQCTPPTPTCLVNLVWCILSPRYRHQSSATLCSANYAILSAEVPPKLSFCYDQTLSQSENVPAMPTCHHHSNHMIIWWEANIWGTLFQNEISIMQNLYLAEKSGIKQSAQGDYTQASQMKVYTCHTIHS